MRQSTRHLRPKPGVRCALLFACLCGTIFYHPAYANTPSTDILVLHSYHQGFNWTDNIQRGINEGLGGNNSPYERYVEYMDSKRTPPDTLFDALRALYTRKYAGMRFGAIICSDNNAFNFLRRYGDSLFGSTPVVFCGVNNYDDSLLGGRTNYTGIVEDIDIPGTIDAIRALQPDVTTLAVVSDNVPTGILHMKRFSDEFRRLRLSQELEPLVNLTADELAQKLSSLSPQSAVVHLSLYLDKNGRRFSADEGLQFVVTHSPVPVYCLWDFWVGKGAVGGVVTSGKKQGLHAAQYVKLLIEHDSAAVDLDIVTHSPNQPIFDYNKLVEHSLSVKSLPAQSMILNRPFNFYQAYKKPIWGTVIVFFLLGALVVLLAVSNIRRGIAEEELRSQKELAANVLANIPHYVFWKDTAGTYLGCNDNFAQGVGLDSPEGITGLTDHDLPWPTEMTGCYTNDDAEVVKTNVPKMGIEEKVHFVTGTIDSLTSKVPLHNAHGTVTGVLGVCYDMTEQKRMHAELGQAQKLSAIGLLVGGIAHDFNNLLTGITCSVEILLLEYTKDSNLVTHLQCISDVANRAADLIRKLLLFSRNEKSAKISTRAHDVIDETTSIIKRSFDKKITISVKKKAENDVLLGDPTALQNVLINLAVNGRDAMPQGGEMVFCTENRNLDDQQCVKMGAGIKPGTYIVIHVVDTGSGIPREIQEKIFDPFYSTKSRGKGTGLGLSAAYGTIKEHNGTIKVSSIEGEGTTFSLYLPVHTESSAIPDQNDHDRVQLSRCIHKNAMVLIIDDERPVRNSLAAFLNKCGCSVETASSGTEAINKLSKNPHEYSAIVLDMIMPEMDGIECHEHIKKINSDIPVIVLSGYIENDKIDIIKKRGVSNILQKPCNMEELIVALNTAIH